LLLLFVVCCLLFVCLLFVCCLFVCCLLLLLFVVCCLLFVVCCLLYHVILYFVVPQHVLHWWWWCVWSHVNVRPRSWQVFFNGMLLASAPSWDFSSIPRASHDYWFCLVSLMLGWVLSWASVSSSWHHNCYRTVPPYWSLPVFHSNARSVALLVTGLTAAYYNDIFFLKHRKKRSSGGSTASSADDGHWMSTGNCRSNGRYLIRAPSSDIYILWATWNQKNSLKSHLII
jgi:hypothetical protein